MLICDILKIIVKKEGYIMKKISLLLVFVIIFSVAVTACGAEEKEVFDVDFEMKSDKVDLEGVSIIYEIGLPDSALATPGCLGYELDTTFGDLASQRLKDIQNDFNCTINLKYVNNGVSCRAFVATSASGVFMCDVISGTSDMWADVARIGMVIGMSELEDYIDYRNEEKWGYRNMLEVVYYEDDLYGLVPLLWPEVSVSYGNPLVVNENMISALGVTDPRDLLENGQWDWDMFDDCLGQYYIEEGGEVKQYSLTASRDTIGNMFILSNGSHFAEKDASGKYIPGFFTPNGIKAMDAAKRIFDGPNGKTVNYVADPIQSLISGTTVLGAANSDNIIGITGRISKEMDNFGILSWPCGPDVEPGYAAGHHANIERCIAFSRMSTHPEVAATIINAVYEPFEGYETLDSIIDLMTRNYFFDKRDSEVFYNMYFNSVYNYFHYSGMYGYMHEWFSSNKTPTEYIEGARDMIQQKIDEYVLPTMRGIEAVWGKE